MQPFYWNSRFEVGIPEVDAQHHRLLDLVNALAEAAGGGARLPDLEALASALLDYASVHFADEERWLADAPLPAGAKEAHVREHRGFTEKVRGILERRDLAAPAVIQSVLDFLLTWLVSHILGVDRKLAVALGCLPPEREAEPGLAAPPVERILLAAMTDAERRFRVLSDDTPALIWVADAAGNRGFFNRAWSEALGLAPAELAARWADFLHPEDRDAYLGLMASLLADPRAEQAEYRLRTGAGWHRWYFERILPRRGVDGAFLGFVASAADITPLKEAEGLLHRANREMELEMARREAHAGAGALLDPLTGLASRRGLMNGLLSEMDRARRYGRALSVLVLDLDPGPGTNGPGAGDEVLVAAAGLLNRCVRASDRVGRYGGAAFLVLLPDTGPEAASAAAERWLAALRELRAGGVPGPSAGVSDFRGGDTLEGLLGRCDRALGRAKAEGGGVRREVSAPPAKP